MRRPLLSAEELLEAKAFPKDDLSLLPKLVSSDILIEGDEEEFTEQDSSKKPKVHTMMARITSHCTLTGPKSLKPTYLVEVEVLNVDFDTFSYEPGDSFGVFPESSVEEVKWLSDRLTLNPQALIKISASSAFLNQVFPHCQSNQIQTSIGDLLKRLDFRSFPKKAALRALAEFCLDPEESLILFYLSSKSGSSAYNRLRNEIFSTQTLLAALSSCQPPLDLLTCLLGGLQARYYSCCRKGDFATQSPPRFQFVFNVTEYAPLSTPECKLQGVASSWLEGMIYQQPTPSPPFPIVQRSIKQFRLPSPVSSSQPIIMIATGTAVAPFIGFLDVLAGIENEADRPHSWLIFGFRTSSDDFLFQKELQNFKDQGVLSKLSLAISRDPDERKRQYCQDVIEADGEGFVKMMQQNNGLCYICGDELTLIKGINDSIVKAITIHTSLSSKEAEALLLQWTKDKRILRDIWI